MTKKATYFIGWDVGAWKCSAGLNDSCDALVVLRDDAIIGRHRANFSSTLHELATLPEKDRTESFINTLFALTSMGSTPPSYSTDDRYYVAIDTPLGWPKDFDILLKGSLPKDWKYNHLEANIHNTLLYRYTEREKLAGGLSVIVDSIGSQSVKGLVLLRTLDVNEKSWGVWTAKNVTFLETYPKACLVRPAFVRWIRELNLCQSLAGSFKVLVSKKPNKYETWCVIPEDLFDAGVCACVAKAFADGAPLLVTPNANDPEEYRSEGWIFYPQEQTDGVNQSIADGHRTVTCAKGVETFDDAIVNFQKYIQSRSAAQ